MTEQEIRDCEWLDRENARRMARDSAPDPSYRVGRSRDLVELMLDYDRVGRLESDDQE